jgi:hypothetical protein
MSYVTVVNFDTSVPEHWLNGPKYRPRRPEVGQPLVTQVVPVQVDLPEPDAIDASTRFARPVVAVRKEKQRLRWVSIPRNPRAGSLLPTSWRSTTAFSEPF